MTVAPKDIKWYGCVVESESDATPNVGGAIDESVKKSFTNVGGLVQAVSEDAGDTANVTLTSLTLEGATQAEVKALTGRTPAAFTTAPDRILKAVKAATCAGTVAVEAQTSTYADTALDGGVDYIDLDPSTSPAPSDVEDAYAGMVVRITAGTNQYYIGECIGYNGTDKRLYLGTDMSGAADNTTVVRIAPGLIFDLLPSEIMTVRRICYLAAADGVGGAERVIYDKVFIKNTFSGSPLEDVASASVRELSDPSTHFAFGLADTLDDVVTIGDRLTYPGTTCDSAEKAVANAGVLTAGSAQGVWIGYTRPVSGPKETTTYSLGLFGVQA